MNYRRNSGKLRALTALCVVLAVLAVGMGSWAVVNQVRISKLSARVAALEAGGAASQSGGAAAPADYDPEAIAAEFDGGVVTAAEAAEEYQTLSSYYEMLGSQPGEYEEDAKTTVLDGLVEKKLLAKKAEDLGLTDFTDEEKAEIEAQGAADYEENLRYYMDFRAEEGKSEEETRAETEAYLASTGYTLESAVEEARQSAIQQRLYDYVTSQYSMDDSQLRELYDQQLESAELAYAADYSEYEMDIEAGRAVVWNPEGVRRVQAVLIPFDADQGAQYLSLSAAMDAGEDEQAGLDALYEALEPTAQQALDRLNAGEDIAALMAEYGSLGPAEGCCVTPEGALYGDEFLKAALALEKIGDLSGIVRTSGGLCILRYASDIAAGPVPFEQAADGLRGGYEDEEKLNQYNAAVTQWIADAHVQYHTDRF